ncbi:MAG: hypothetical protein HZB51_15750 [Chloroflexi bacterium]|nr:hypothetical protein [Chloroflexota bacterium]
MTRQLKIILVLALALVTSACSVVGAAPTSKPTVAITSPANNSQFQPGDQVTVQSTSLSDQGIMKVDLVVDGNVVRSDPSPQPQSSFTVTQAWTATPGTHTITVRATNAVNVTSDPATITVVVQAAAETPAATATLAASPTPAATQSPTPAPTTAATQTSVAPTATTVPGTCANNSLYLADVTVPDGTVLATNQPFNKIWRVRNTGTCDWSTGYTLALIGGEAMTTTTTIALPAAAAGATVDVLVPMVAPTTPGSYTNIWRMRTANGTLFGTRLTTVINVIQTAANPPTNNCPFTPVIESFSTSAGSITSGQSATLTWGFVVGAERAEIDNGIGGVSTPGSTTVTPASTTTYTMTAVCGAKVTTAQVTITVVSPTAAPTATTTP